ncbi:MAG TPA: LysM peptidoglycan-binding domain-containing protein [bacterium]
MSARTRAARCAATAAGAVVLVVGGACAPVRDQTARQDVESLQSSVQQIESALQARQAGVYEQIRELREDQARLERLIEENTRQGRAAAQQLEALRQKTGEDFQKRDQAQREAAQAGAERLGRIEARLDALQKGLLTVNDNLVAMSEFEKKQEERLAKVQEQFQGQLKVVVEEVGRENQDLSRGLASARADLEATRQETAAVRQGLVELQRPMQELAEQLAAVQTQIQDLGRRVESQRKAAPARGGSTHTVRAGETLTAIAARYGVTVKALRDKNQLSDADSLREGQKLAIPEP